MSELLINIDKVSKIEIVREKRVQYKINNSLFLIFPIISWFVPEIFSEGQEFYNYDSFCNWLRYKKGFTKVPSKSEVFSDCDILCCSPSLAFYSTDNTFLGRKYFSNNKELEKAIEKIRKVDINFIHFTLF
jgi:hypothetical protein